MVWIVLLLFFGYLIMLNDVVNTRTGLFGISLLSYLNACAYCFLLHKLSKHIVTINYLNNILQIIGRYSIVFLCTNHVSLRVSLIILRKLSFTTGCVIDTILQFIIAMILMFIIVFVVKKTRLKQVFNY